MILLWKTPQPNATFAKRLKFVPQPHSNLPQTPNKKSNNLPSPLVVVVHRRLFTTTKTLKNEKPKRNN
jgi:hypothetical protein